MGAAAAFGVGCVDEVLVIVVIDVEAERQPMVSQYPVQNTAAQPKGGVVVTVSGQRRADAVGSGPGVGVMDDTSVALSEVHECQNMPKLARGDSRETRTRSLRPAEGFEAAP